MPGIFGDLVGFDSHGKLDCVEQAALIMWENIMKDALPAP